MDDKEKKIKTIYDIQLHEMLELKTEVGGTIEVTRVPGGWCYAFNYPGYRQSPVVFVPFSALKDEFMDIITKKKEK